MNFKFLEVKDSDMLDKVFAFRYKIIKNTPIFQDYFHDTTFRDNKESDIFDPYSIHFVAVDNHHNICATVRLIYNCPYGYPTEKGMIFNHDMFDRDKLGEMSRIFVDAKYRNIKTTKVIIDGLKKFMYIKMTQLGIEYTYGALEPSFVRLLKMYKMPYEIIGKKQLQGKMGLRYPCILYTDKLGKDNPKLIELWKSEYEK